MRGYSPLLSMLRRPARFFFLFILIVSLSAFTPQVKTRNPKRIARRLRANVNQEYIIQLPSEYESKERYPLLVAVHGETEAAYQQFDLWTKYADHGKYILVCPQFKEGYQQFKGKENIMLMNILIELKKEFPFDEGLVYVAGFAGGAQFTHRFAFKHPSIVKAVAVIAADEYDEPPKLIRNRWVKFFLGVGEHDRGKYLDRVSVTENFYSQLIEKKFIAAFRIYTDLGHVMHPDMVTDVMAFFNRLTFDELNAREKYRKEP